MNAILGKRWLDFALVFMPGLVAFFAFRWFQPDSVAFVIGSFIAVHILDSGHSYTTALRVYRRANTDPRPSPRLKITYMVIPIVSFAVVTFWIYARVPGFWTMLLYFTLFHHTRQLYGILRWYQKLNRRFDAYSHLFLYAFVLLPAVLFHGRSGFPSAVAERLGFMMFDAPALSFAVAIVYVATIVAWLTFELTQWRSGHRELNRIAAIGVPGLVCGLCFLVGQTIAQVIFPLMVMHAVTYLAIMAFSIERVSKPHTGWSAIRATVLLAVTAGCIEWALFHRDALLDYQTGPASLALAIAFGLYAVVPLSHYALDAIIWRGDHPEASQIYANSPPHTTAA